MTKICKIFFCLLLILILTACGTDDVYEQQQTMDEISYEYIYGYIHEYAHDNEPYPFGVMLLNYFAGSVRAPEGIPATAAFKVDIDGNGTPGVLAIRHELQGLPFARLFVIYDGFVTFLDFGYQSLEDLSQTGFEQGNNFFAFSVTADNRPVHVLRGFADTGYTMYTVENGALVIDFSISGELFAADGTIRDDFYYFLSIPSVYTWDNWPTGEDNRRRLTKQEFNEIRAEHGLDTLPGTWLNLPDQTREIMGMELYDQFRSMELLDPDVHDYLELDYIPVSNLSNTLPVTYLQVGDDFLGLVLEEIIVSRVPVVNNEPNWGIAEFHGVFSGEMIVSGSLQHWDSAPELTVFIMDDSYLDMFPGFYPEFNPQFISVANREFVEELLGFSLSDMMSEYTFIGEIYASIRIGNIQIDSFGGHNIPFGKSVDVMEIISYDADF